MKQLYEKDVEYSKEQIEAIRRYKIHDSFYTLLRQNCFDDLFDLYKQGDTSVVNEGRGSLEQFAKEIVEIEEFFKLPELKHNLVVYRGGGREINEGETKDYNSLVSTAVNFEVAKEFADKNQSKNIYKLILPKGTQTIPIELVPITDYYISKISENEILLPPISFYADKKEPIITDSGETYEKISGKDIKVYSLLQNFKGKMDLLSQHITTRLNDALNDTRVGHESEDLLNKMIALGYDRNDIENTEVLSEHGNQLGVSDAIQRLKDSGKFEAFLERYHQIDTDKLQYGSLTHGKEHTKRVLFNTMVIAELEGLSAKDVEVLEYAVQYHDIGRKHDFEDAEHGSSSSEIIDQEALLEDKNLTPEDKNLIKFMVVQHSKSKRENDMAIQQLPIEQQDRYKKLLDCLKDGDKLDRVRLGKGELDSNRLSLDSSKRLVTMTYQSYFTLTDIIALEDMNKEVASARELMQEAINRRTKEQQEKWQEENEKEIKEQENMEQIEVQTPQVQDTMALETNIAQTVEMANSIPEAQRMLAEVIEDSKTKVSKKGIIRAVEQIKYKIRSLFAKKDVDPSKQKHEEQTNEEIE